MNPNRSRPRTLRRVAAPAAALALVFAAACGGDDAGAPDDTAPPTDAPDDAADADADADDDVADDPVDPPSDDADAAAEAAEEAIEDAVDEVVLSDPAAFLAAELHPIDLPAPGTAVVRVAGETFELAIEACGILRVGSTESLTVTGSGETSDGAATFFAMARNVTAPDAAGPGTPHEADVVTLGVEQGVGTGENSVVRHEVSRETVSAPLLGDGTDLPVVLVVEDGDDVAATAVADLVPSATSMFDGAPTGPAEFAVNCD